jgi:hypothetical protein
MVGQTIKPFVPAIRLGFAMVQFQHQQTSQHNTETTR